MSAIRLAIVLWNGDIGGAEVFTAALARQMQELGAKPGLVFVGNPEPLAERLAHSPVPWTSLGFRRGREVLWHPRRYAAGVRAAGPDGALLVECGFMAASLRQGGYSSPIVAVEHGALLRLSRYRSLERIARRAARVIGARAVDAEVAVSQFMLDFLRRHPHAAQTVKIYNGIEAEMESDREVVRSSPTNQPPDRPVVGFAGRLIKGKGAATLIRAIAEARRVVDIDVWVAGDGPQRSELTALTARLNQSIEWFGTVDDLATFWSRCDVAVVPSIWPESFSMVTLEAMAAGVPVVASRIGGIPELVVDGVTGTLVPPGDVTGVGQALIAYATSAALRRRHGDAARVRARRHFNMRDTAQAYLDLCTNLRMQS